MAVLEVNVVGALAELLRDRYRRGPGEFPILKEIIQNADDACATELHLVVLEEGFANAQNPLLHGPALVCINDGPFTEEHENALRYFGLTSKAADHAAVGRFGLGQKSIFHLAEAYFYLGRASSESPVLADVIDPWEGPKGDREKPEWTVFSPSDRTRVQRALAPWLERPAFFVLYIPLRREIHRRASGSVISQHFPVLRELTRDLEDLAGLGTLLPQLQSVGRIESWTLSVSTGARTSLGRAVWTSRAGSLSRVADDRPFARAFGGAIELATSASTRNVRAFGFERCVKDPLLIKLLQDPRWPRRVDDPVAGKDVPEKAVPHGAVTVQCSTDGPPGLMLGWAVFLPLGTGDSVLHAPGLRSSWRIWLHAYGFPDSGRRSFTGVDESTNGERDHFTELHVRWNVRLVDVATLACLLDALAPAVEAVDVDEGENMVRALVASSFWSRHAGAVKGDFRLAWGPGVSADGAAPESRALRIPAERRILRVRRPATDEFAKVGDVLRAWLHEDLAADAALTWADSPILGPEPRSDAWDAAHLERTLARIEPRVLGRSPAALAYVADVLEDIARSSPSTGTAIHAFLRRCFREAVLTVGEQGAEWTRLAALCPPGTILWSSAGVTALRELSRERTSILLLPSKLRPSASAAPVVSLDDARTLLRNLSAKVRSAEVAADAESMTIVAEIVGAVGPASVLRDSELGALPLFRVWSARHSRHICAEPAELAALSARGCAFRNRGVVAPEQLARKLRACVGGAEVDVLLVNDDAVADAMAVPPFDLELLARGLLHPSSRAGTLEERLDLFRHVAFGAFAIRDAEERARSSIQVRRALRLLIHGFSERASDDTPLFLADIGPEEPFAEIASGVLEVMGDGWRVVGEAFGHLLSRGWQAALGIRPLTEEILISAMSENEGPWRLTVGQALGSETCPALARLLARKAADRLFASLAIHHTRDGAIVCGGQPGVWLEGQWKVPPSLKSRVRLIVLSGDDVIREAQERSLRPVWSPEEQIAVCLASDPARYTRELLDAVECATLSRDLRTRLREARWLPTTQGDLVQPADVLDVPAEVDRALRALLGDAELVFRAPGMIDAESRQHRAFRRVLDELALRDDEAVNAIAQQLDVHVDEGANRFWVLAAAARDQEREFLVRGLAAPCLRSDPTWAFLASVERWMLGRWTEGAGGRELLALLRRGPSAKRVTDLLVRFRDEKDLAPADVEPSRQLFEDYLRYARARPDFVAGVLPNIYLLNANKTWRATTAIAASDANLQDQFRLLAAHRQILGAPEQLAAEIAQRSAPQDSNKRGRPGQAEVKRSVETLGKYFAAWTGRVSPEAIGYFLACLGEGVAGSVAKLAHGYLHPSSTVEGAREKLLYDYRAVQISTEFGALRDALWAVDVVDEGEAREVPSLAGTTLQAKVAGSSLGGIFVGDIPGASGAGQWLRLRRVDPAAHEPRELHQALGVSVRAFLQSALSVPLGPAFEVFWGELGRGGQAQIEAVRSMVLEHLHVHLEALQLRQDDRFRALLVDIDRAEQRFRELSGNRGVWQDAQNKAEQKRRDCHAALRKALEEEEDAQRRVVRAVRSKLGHYQYSVEQVLLELFQNADDAASELLGAKVGGASSEHEQARQLHIYVDRGAPSLRVEHWGRPINRAGIVEAGSTSPERAYELDLKNMLVLNLSDKDAASTGRFGLGFKSVHLLTHRPRVRSGDLSFEIVGGILPQLVPYDGAPEISTRVELPLDDAALADRALSRLASFGSLLPVFARAIRRLVVEDGEHREATWEPTLVGGCEALEVGSVPGALGGVRSESRRLLVVRGTGGNRRFAVAFPLGVAGVDAFAPAQPEIWCTAPTLECWGMGYCINAPFVLDVGRGQLARDSSENLRMFHQLGDLLASGLRQLAELFTVDFARVVAELGLEVGSREPDAVRHRFWRSMFERLTQLPDGALDRTALVRAMHERAGLGAVASEYRVLPTGLPGRHHALTTTREVEWVFDEVVAQSEVFDVLTELGWLGKNVAPGKAIHIDVYRRLMRIGAHPKSATLLDFAQVLERSIPARTTVTPDMARSLWRLLRALENAAHLPGRPDEVLRTQLGASRFTTAADKPQEPSVLLLGRSLEVVVRELDRKRYHDLGDELMRADFAFPQHVLHAKYAERPMVELFLFARQRLQRGGAADLARWARDAADGAKQRAALAYLATGEQAEGMSAELKKLGGLTWCQRTSDLDALTTASPLSESALAHLRIRCGFQPSLVPSLGDVFEDEDDEDQIYVPTSARIHDPGVVLARIARWWAARGRAWTEQHDKRVYTGLKGGVNGLRDELRNERTEAWALLFTIAACQRLGRQSYDQHAGFVRRLQEQGEPKWWSTVAGDPRKVKPEAWMRVIDQWLDARIDSDPYRLWLGLFPTLYQLHRHGSVYRQLLKRADHDMLARMFSLDAHLAPRANPALGGAGAAFDAPPLGPALGIGATWILRELVRLEVVTRKAHLAPFCYVPRAPTRRLMQRLGASDLEESGMSHAERSRRIHGFLAKVLGDQATFGGAFDLPLYLYETDLEAHHEAEVS